MRFLKRILLAVLILGGLASFGEASRWNPYLQVFPSVLTPQNGTIDPNGNRQSQIETNAGRTETTTYDYDEVNRLTEVTYETGTPSAKTTTYTYDKVGNRLTEQEVEVETANVLKDLVYDYDGINRLETITDNLDAAQNVAYGYDANGNTVSKTKAGVETTFLYNIRDQLSEVQQGASVLGRYGYDYDGRRILKIGDDGRRHYTYDQQSVLIEAEETGVTVGKYEYGLDQLVSLRHRTEGRSFYHLSALDSVSNLTDELGSSRISYFYDAWGIERDRIGASTNRFTFNSLEFDEETNLFYAINRFYDPETGRFLSQDPLLGNVSRAPSLNRYTYSFSNPLRFVDPYGLSAGDWYDPRSYDWGVFATEFGKGLGQTGLAIVTFGGGSRVQQAMEEGRIDATSSSWEVGGVFAEGVFNTVTFGAFESTVEAVAEGKGIGEALVEGGGSALRTALPVEESTTLLSSEASGYEKAEAVATGTTKVAMLLLASKAVRSKTPSVTPRTRANVSGGSRARVVSEAPQSTKAGAESIARSQSAGTQASRQGGFRVGERMPDGRIAGEGPGAALRGGPEFAAKRRVTRPLSDAEINAAFEAAESRTMFRLPGKEPATGQGLVDVELRSTPGKPIEWHENLSFRDIKGAPATRAAGGSQVRVQVRTHGPNRNAPAGSVSRSQPTTQISTPRNEYYMLPDGSWKPRRLMTDADWRAVHIR